jgi:hypothetical protein
MKYTIYPYKIFYNWVFDDAKMGLRKESLVQGIPKMIRLLTKDIKNPEKGFKLTFSDEILPNYNAVLYFIITNTKNWSRYALGTSGVSGWLCPSLMKYFKKPPKKIYCLVEEKIK